MITILELFPLYSTCIKWGLFTSKERVRLIKEFTIHRTTESKERYTVDGFLHREDGPAYIEHGDRLFEMWMIHGNPRKFKLI